MSKGLIGGVPMKDVEVDSTLAEVPPLDREGRVAVNV